MRSARLVGPTPDGTSVVLVTDEGEELAVDLGDPAARAAWLAAASTDADRPGSSTPPTSSTSANAARRPPRRRETPMDTPLSPRDIQVRIRSGESVEDLVASSGMDPERVERFAAPVLAEREHVALIALGSSVRRRGESSGHRSLRAVVAERLLAQGVDADAVAWDAWKRDDGHWQLSADYDLRDEPRHAEFSYDPQGRFSLADDDEARWLAGERPSPVAAAVDRDDELALVRATREDAPEETRPGAEPEELAQVLELAEELGAVLQVVPPLELSAEELDELVAEDPESDEAHAEDATGEPDDAHDDDPSDDADDADDPADAAGPGATEDTLVAPRDEAAEPTIAVVRRLTSVTVAVEGGDADSPATTAAEARSALDTLYDMLGGDGYAEESPRVYPGLSDASAVPVVDEHEFEPPADVQVPAEPGTDPDEPADPDAPAQTHETDERGEPAASGPAGAGEAPATVPHEGLDDPSPEAPAARGDDDADEPLIPSPGAPRRPGRRKRASVPSWDEIMFGGPKPG